VRRRTYASDMRAFEAYQAKQARRRQYRVEGCSTCARDPEGNQIMPPHDASNRCESGRRSHCSCDTCF
jgi:hypothetical protein